MNTTELLQVFRDDVQDAVEPYFWTDAEIYRYMNDAYFMFARLTGGIPDFTSDACTVSVSRGDPVVDLHPSILTIREAFLLPDNRPVDILNVQNMAQFSDEDYGLVRKSKLPTTFGRPRHLIVGMEKHKGRTAVVPDADYEMSLVIDRLPLEPLTGADEDISDIDEYHHLHLLSWMRALAYGKQDADAFNAQKQESDFSLFRAYSEQVKKEKERYKHRVRVVSYGGL